MPFGAYGRLPYFHYFQKPEKVIFSILLVFSIWDLFLLDIEVPMDMSESTNVKWAYTINGIRREWRIATLFPLFPP